MSQNALIEQHGMVSEIGAEIIRVNLNVQSACAACHAKGVCGVDSAQKTIDIRTSKTSFRIGEMVNVTMRESLGMKALFLGYLLPFIVVVSTLFIMMSFGFSEGISGIASLAILFPYYVGLYFFKDKIKREFNFDIEKI